MKGVLGKLGNEMFDIISAQNDEYGNEMYLLKNKTGIPIKYYNVFGEPREAMNILVKKKDF